MELIIMDSDNIQSGDDNGVDSIIKAMDDVLGDFQKPVFVPVSMDLLYDGLVTIHDNIYDYSGETVVLATGKPLTKEAIDRIRRHFVSVSEEVKVSYGTHRALMERYLGTKIPDRKELEHRLAYDKMAVLCRRLIEDIRANEALPMELITKLLKELKDCYSKASLSDIFCVLHVPCAREDDFYRHFLNVALLNSLIGAWKNLGTGEVEQLMLVGLLHDIGMALLPESLIMAPRALAHCEFEVIKMHTVRGFDMMKNSGFSDLVKYGVTDHHERIDGSGYPYGVGGGSISFAARVTAVADVYAARVAGRGWREAESPFNVAANLAALAGEEFDEDIVEVFVKKLMKEMKGRPIRLSSGDVAMVSDLDFSDLTYPTVKFGGEDGKVVKTNQDLFCKGFYFSKASEL